MEMICLPRLQKCNEKVTWSGYLAEFMILSLFIALITDTYETIKHYQQDGFPETELRTFISECKDLPSSGKYRLKDDSPVSIFCCCKK